MPVSIRCIEPRLTILADRPPEHESGPQRLMNTQLYELGSRSRAPRSAQRSSVSSTSDAATPVFRYVRPLSASEEERATSRRGLRTRTSEAP